MLPRPMRHRRQLSMEARLTRWMTHGVYETEVNVKKIKMKTIMAVFAIGLLFGYVPPGIAEQGPLGHVSISFD